MSTFNKQASIDLAKRKAKVLVNDIVDGERVRVLRTVIGSYSSRSGRASHWGVELNKPLADGCTKITYQFIALVLQ